MYIKVFEDDGHYLEWEVKVQGIVYVGKSQADLMLSATNPNFDDVHISLSYAEVVDLGLLMLEGDRKLTELALTGEIK